MEETRFMITPSELDVKNLFAYLCKYCSFNDVMELYRLFKYDIDGTKRLEKKKRK